ncbi:uncharacterized protein [Dermacentor albipictus]|uniref:uncharacterized protein isoform X2 n=1 Tax=Dermacentor albipictus TaxID=60249 RepID=UPI0031FD1974
MQTDNATRKTPTSVGTPTMSSLPSNATTTTTAKPMVLCQLVSPSYFETGTLRNAVEGQEVPSSTMCDYILLDLPLAANGSFEVDSYRFLTRAKHRLLFHVDIDLQGVGSGSFLVNSNSTPFVESVQYLQHAHGSSKIHGLGVLKGLPTLLSLIGQGWTKFYLDLIYSGFAEILRDSGVDQGKIKNFFAFNPGLVTQDTYKQHLSLLNSITDLNLVIILTITNERVAQVYPSSAWDNRCLPQSFDTTMADAVSAITNTQNPKVEFALALSLRLDFFTGVSLAKVQGDSLQQIQCRLHEALWFSTLYYGSNRSLNLRTYLPRDADTIHPTTDCVVAFGAGPQEALAASTGKITGVRKPAVRTGAQRCLDILHRWVCLRFRRGQRYKRYSDILRNASHNKAQNGGDIPQDRLQPDR